MVAIQNTLCSWTARVVQTSKKSSPVERKWKIRSAKSRDNVKEPLNNPCLTKQRIQATVQHTKLHALAVTKNDAWFPLPSSNYNASRLPHCKSCLFTVRTRSRQVKLPLRLGLPTPCTDHITFVLDGNPLRTEMQPVLHAVDAIPQAHSLESIMAHSAQ